MANFYLDRRIKDRFKLFQGLRLAADDQAIYEEIYSQVYGEVLRFIEANLDPDSLATLLQEITELPDSEGDSANLLLKPYSIIISRLEGIEDGQARLEFQLDHFLNNLLIQAQNKHL